VTGDERAAGPASRRRLRAQAACSEAHACAWFARGDRPTRHKKASSALPLLRGPVRINLNTTNLMAPFLPGPVPDRDTPSPPPSPEVRAVGAAPLLRGQRLRGGLPARTAQRLTGDRRRTLCPPKGLPTAIVPTRRGWDRQGTERSGKVTV
jgi:hypothetical protein